MKEDSEPPKRRTEVVKLKNLVNVLIEEVQELRNEIYELKKNQQRY